MKKIVKIICLILSVGIMSIVSAKESDNKLYFTNEGDRLYYDTKLYDAKVFMNHTDMVPGSSYTDTLLIENGTDTNYKLYFKVKELEQNEKANEILDNILMEIYIGDELIYDGKVKGLDYNDSGINLQDAIYIGEYNKNTEKELVVKTSFNEDFSDKDNTELSHIEWQFYAQYEDKLVIINPNTGDNIKKVMYMCFITLAILICFIVILKLRTKKYV